MEERQWTPVTLIKTTEEYLAGKGIHTPKLDAEILLRHVLKLKNRIELYTQFERPLAKKEVDRYRALVRRRAEREPVNRILGETEFMGLPMMVTPNVLAPRSDTEILAEQAIDKLGGMKRVKRSEALFAKAEAVEAANQNGSDADVAKEPKKSETVSMNPMAPLRVLDLCTGSGCVAIAIATFVRKSHVVASDISEAALAVARENVTDHSIWERMDFRLGDMFEVCWPGEMFDMIVCNPPYLVEGDDEIWPEVSRFDPPEALYGGEDGLFFYREIAVDAGRFLSPGGHLLLEVGAGQAGTVTELLRASEFKHIEVVNDHQQVPRVVIARAA